MKKTILSAISLLMLVGAGCNQLPSTPSGDMTSTLQSYRNGTYGFTFTYPSTMEFVTPSYPLLQDKIVQLSIPQTGYPKTNFGDAAFSVSASYAKTLSACLAANTPQNSDGFKKEAEINGTTFYFTKGAGAGAGNRYDSTIYRTLVGGQTCLELNETIHTTNIANYPSGTVTEIDKNVVQARLDAILNSFTLNSTSTNVAPSKKITGAEEAKWQIIDTGPFAIFTPQGWKFTKLQGIDSFIGEFTGDGMTLVFDFGHYSNSLAEDDDKDHTVTYETINGHKAKIAIPKTGKLGLTGVYISGISNNALVIYGKNLSKPQQDVALAIFRTITFK